MKHGQKKTGLAKLVAGVSARSRPAARYVFFDSDNNSGEDGAFFTADEPTAEDVQSAEVGCTIILRLSDLHYLGRKGKWLPLPEGGLATPDIEGQADRPHHVHPTYL